MFDNCLPLFLRVILCPRVPVRNWVCLVSRDFWKIQKIITTSLRVNRQIKPFGKLNFMPRSRSENKRYMYVIKLYLELTLNMYLELVLNNLLHMFNYRKMFRAPHVLTTWCCVVRIWNFGSLITPVKRLRRCVQNVSFSQIR